MPYEDHQKSAGQPTIACAVITCSDSRSADTDTSGQKINEMLQGAGHEVAHYEVTKDEPSGIRQILRTLAHRADIQAIIFNGGTGISRRDNTYDAVSGLLTKTLPGFGEIFRMLSYESIGSGAMLSRAIAGIIVTQGLYGHEQHTVVFSIPGSPQAVELAMEKLILPELPHLVWETKR
jgi:molybdenum cofactor biosynthesis protein B